MARTEKEEFDFASHVLTETMFSLMTDNETLGIQDDDFLKKMYEKAARANIKKELVREILEHIFESKILYEKDGRYFPGESYYPRGKHLH